MSTTKKMLINATQPEEIRVATIFGQRLEDLDIEHPNKDQKKSNIYLAVISRIEPSLEAVFVNYGGNRHGFLPLKEIESSYFLTRTDDPKSDIKKILKEGQELLIQVDKDERGNKGAALTTYISLAGCYLVLMPNNSKAGGISRRIEGEDRDQMKQVLNSLNIPNNMGVIIRTAGLGKNIDDLQWDLDVLLQHWQAIKSAAGSFQAPCLLHQESNIIIRAIRDNLRPDIKEIFIDDKEVYNQAKKYMELLRADSKHIVKLYQNNIPLFTKFQIESQIENAFHHEIRLPSGGSIVFDPTEALTAIDINSAQSTKGQDIENTALNTNLEAATEIARQLRLRDVGGLIVIDFIDMSYIKNQREVENRLRDALQNDRARIQVGRISKFGLLEMSRQRLKSSLGESTQVICPKCSGKGSLRTVESLALSVIRVIEEESLKPKTSEIQVQLPIELCTFLANEKREKIIEIENNYKVRIVLIPNQYYEFPNFKISRIKSDEISGNEQIKSYKVIEQSPEKNYISSKQRSTETKSETAAVQHISLSSKQITRPSKPSLLKRLWTSFSLFSTDENLIQTTTNQQPDRKYDHKKIQHRTEGSKKLRTNKNSRNKTNLPHNATNKIETPKDKRTKQHNQYKKHHKQFIDENILVSAKHEYHHQETSRVIEKNESPTDILYSKDNQPGNLTSIIPNDQNINLIRNSQESLTNEKQQNQYEAVYDKATSYQKMDTRNREKNKPQTNEPYQNKGSKAKNDRTQRKITSETQKQVDDICSMHNKSLKVQAEAQKLQESDITNSVGNISNDAAVQITPLQVFIKHSDRTRILPVDSLTKKRFYPKKKLPYEINKSLSSFEDNDEDSSKIYNTESDITSETNISEDFPINTDVFIDNSEINHNKHTSEIATNEKNSLEENQK